MKTIHDIYRARLRLLVSEYGSQTALAAALDRPSAQISQWIRTGPSSRQLSPATARLIEKTLGKPAGWMDQPLDVFHGDEAASLAELRRRHLYRLFTQAGSFGMLSERTGQHPRHLMGWVDGSLLMDAEHARKIERALLLPAGQLDTWADAPTNNWRPLAREKHETSPMRQPPRSAPVSGIARSLARRIRQLREARNLSQQQLADRLNISRVAVTKWESGETENMKIDNLLALSDFFGLSIDELITGKRPETAASLSKDEQTLLAAWRSAAQSVRLAVRLMLAPVSVRELLDTETRMALKVIELAAPSALGGQMQRLAAA